MNLRYRIELYLAVRRADRAIAKAEARKAARDHLNRPHVQSVHQIGWWIAPPAPTARDFGVTPRYVALLLVLFIGLFYINTSPEAAKLGCYQVASK